MNISRNKILAVVLGLASALCTSGISFADDSGSTTSAQPKQRHHFHNKAAFKACVAQVGLTADANGKMDWPNVSQGDKAELHQCMAAARQQFKQKMDACLEAKGVSLPLSHPLSADTKAEVKSCFTTVKGSQAS